MVIGLLSLYVSIYSVGYVKGFLGRRSVTSLVVFFAFFLAGMLLVVLSDDAFIFLVSWRSWPPHPIFWCSLRTSAWRTGAPRSSYLVVAHVGAIAILLSFGVMAGLATGFRGFGAYTFDAMRKTELSAGWKRRGLSPRVLRVQRQGRRGTPPCLAARGAPRGAVRRIGPRERRDAQDRGLRDRAGGLRPDRPVPPGGGGAVVLVFGLVSAVMGILASLLQQDLKRLLAYSSVKNIGIILIAIGLAMIFSSFRMTLLAALALTAALYHALNHAMFKGLLFMGAGAVLHATHERNMENMGGLIRDLPWTSVFFLVGCMSISALPPFNGFVSEWLTFQAFLLSPALPSPILNLLIPLGVALLALSSALARRPS